MAYCHECGSEVAKNDIYCPYCGIFLSQSPAAPETADEAEASAETAQNIAEAAEKNAADANVFSQETESAAEKNVRNAGDFSLSDTEEDIDLREVVKDSEISGSLSDQPEPEIAGRENEVNLSETPQTDYVLESEEPENSSAENAFEMSASDELPTPPALMREDDAPNFGSPFSSNIAEIDNTTDETVEKIENENIESPPVGSVGEASSAFVAEEKPVNLFAPETPQIEFPEEISANSVKDPFIETIPDMSSSFTVEDEAEINLEPASSESEKNEKSAFVSEMPDENEESSAAPEISMPSDELDEPVESPAQSMFDSVRIMETAPKPEAAAPPVVEPAAEISPVNQASVPPEPAAAEEEAKDSRSYTTPNIGGSDTDGRKAAKLKPLDEGTLLNNRYEIIRKIGGGGMGAVYLASDNNLGGVLRAVKEMVQSYIEETQQDKAVADFKRESMILSTLDHPAIPTIYDYFYDDKESRFYLVMKYISGGDLSSRLRAASEGKLDEKTVTEWAIQIADVLDYLHNQPNTIVYRDLKPSNVMIDGNSGRVMLIDFGIARSVNKEEKGVTAVGTMGYAPPELFSGNVEARSDIYSLGSTMFHLLTGADPQSNPLLIFDFQKNPRPRQINSQLSDQMERILMRAVEYNATARFASAAEMKVALEEHLVNLKTGRVTYGVGAVPVAVSLQDQPVFCGFCGQKIMATDMFCAFCGSRQPLSQKGVHSEIYSHAPVTAKLMVIGTNELDMPVFNIEKNENLVGRRDPMSNIFPEVDLSKFDPQTKISRRHARIRRDGNNFYLEDLGSSNGTIVIPAVSDSMRLLPHQPHVLSNGDKIRVGDTTLHFLIK